MGLLYITPFGDFETMFFKDGDIHRLQTWFPLGDFLSTDPELRKLMPWHLWHGHFPYFAEGNSPSLSVLGLMYDTTCDLCFVFSVPIFTTTSFCLVSTNPRPYPKKKRSVFSCEMFSLPTQPNQPGFGTRDFRDGTPSKATSLSASLYLSLLQLLRRDYVNAFAELDRLKV